jgi:uncharacterized protein
MSTQATAAGVQRASVSTAQLDPWPIPADQIVDGDPQASGTIIWRSEDGTLASGIWECTPGTFDWNHADETLCLVSGRVTVTPEGGEAFDIVPGDTVFFPEGTRTRWNVTEKLRKAFHLHAAGGLGL